MRFHETKSTILLVDDGPENLNLLTSSLKTEYRILAARDGNKAISLASTQSPDLILLDIIMPGINGFDVLYYLKSNIKTINIPIIFISSIDDRDTIVKGFQAGAQDYITKPFEPEELNARVSTQIRIKKQNDALSSLNQHLESEVKKRTTELSASNQKLQETNTRLKEFDLIKSRFLNIISHEIRTPLTIMSQYMGLIEGESNSMKFKTYMKDLNHAYDRLRSMSEKALLITQLDTDAYQIHLKKIDIRSLVTDCIDELSEAWKSKQIFFPDQSGTGNIDGDIRLIGFLIRSLLDNAIRYSPENGKIHITISHRDNACTICISDEGPGFPVEVLHHAFESFNLGEEPVKIELGLSLAISRLIMKAHHGSIELMNAPDKGAVVQLTFYSNQEVQ